MRLNLNLKFIWSNTFKRTLFAHESWLMRVEYRSNVIHVWPPARDKLEHIKKHDFNLWNTGNKVVHNVFIMKKNLFSFASIALGSESDRGKLQIKYSIYEPEKSLFEKKFGFSITNVATKGWNLNVYLLL